MRILNIYYKNINSLAGEGRVNFDQGPIADSGVFAITGPNGSGKTSILDVITLGLYGETFRFHKPAEHIITKQSNDSFAQVEFAFAGLKYRSTWQVNRTDPDQPGMVLRRLSGVEEILAESPYQVRQYLQELTGMDFHKFSKSIILPQGDFAAFLNALDSERLDILEKIGGTDFYDDYRQQLENKHQSLKDKLDFLNREIDLIPLLSDEALTAIKHDLLDFKELSDDLEHEQSLLEQHQHDLQHITELETRQARLDAQQQTLQAQIEQQQLALQRIAATQQADLFKEDLQLQDTMLAEAELRRSNLNHSRNELAKLQQQLSTAGLTAISAAPAGKSLPTQQQTIGALKLTVSEVKLELPRLTELAKTITQQLSDKQATLQEVETWLQGHQGEAILLSNFPEVAQLRNLRTELAEMGGLQKNQSAWTKKTNASQKKNKSELANTQTRLTELKEQIIVQEKTLLDMAQGKSFADLKELQRDQEKRLGDFEELFSIAGINARFTKKKSWFGWFAGNIVEPELPDEAVLQARVDTLKAEMAREENISRALELAINNEILLKKLTDQRSKLVDGVPCLLCGSLHHPYLSKPPLLTDSKKALADHRSRVQILRSTLNDAEKNLIAGQKRLSQRSAKQIFLQEKRAEWITLANRLNVAQPDLTIDNITLQERLLLAEADELEKIKKLVEDHAQLQRHIAKAKAEIEDKQAALLKLRLTGEQLDANWADQSPEIDEFTQKYQRLQADEKALLPILEPQLKQLGEKLPGPGKENALFDRLNTRRQDYQIRVLRQKGLQEEINDLQEKLLACQTTLVRYQQDLISHQQALQQEELLGLQLAELEKQTLVQAQEQGMKEQELALSSLHNLVSEKLAIHGFASLPEVADALKLIDSQANIELQLTQQAAKLTALQNEQDNLVQQLQSAVAGLTCELKSDEMPAIQKQIAERFEIAEQEIRSLQNKLEKQQQYRQKYQTLDKELQQQSRLFAQADAELQQINAEQGGLRRKIQQLLIDKLLSQTNQTLEKISGRYYVRSTPCEHGLALEIEDSKQHNTRRLPKTLSGGESFVVSLALALALAEIANNGKAVESLFLDEGFGNLDADALYLAMSALESLKTQGKTVGIISHVEAVKKRIKTQIELVKKPDGLSELKMVA